MNDVTKTAGQSDTSREPNRSHNAEPFDAKSHFLGALAQERGEESSSDEQPSQSSGDGKENEESLGNHDEGDEGANENSNSESEPESKLDPKLTIELVNEDNEIIGYADEDGAEYDVEGKALSDDSEGEGDEQSSSADTATELLIDDRRYTADDVRELEKKDKERDADYRRKTALVAKQRQEFDVSGQDLQAVSAFFTNVSSANVRNLETMDTKDMDAGTFQTYRDQLDSARRGKTQLDGQVGEFMKKVNAQRETHKNQQAAESADIIKSIDQRWSSAFYAELRDYAVASERYTAADFAEVTDWRTIEGLIALKDRDEVAKVGKSTTNKKTNRDAQSETLERPQRKRRRQQRKTGRSNATGRYQSAKAAALTAQGGAKNDGSLREMLTSKIQSERGSR